MENGFEWIRHWVFAANFMAVEDFFFFFFFLNEHFRNGEQHYSSKGDLYCGGTEMGKRRGEINKRNFNAVGSKDWKKQCTALGSWLQLLCTRLLVFDDEAGIGWTKQRTD
ncbi:uncharacterized protein TrAFT101_002553 [Trichoderma asperellum]|uniref:uncharacterized protein n=1 Tax=Trichoderma asperellum TaxID=101201 RepID=UPI003321CB0C|nr:hypothetical protein TrAFT101_002553 [Trichoderma asperellum]